MKKGWIKSIICVVLILAFVFQYSATALASFIGVQGETITVYDENGNPVQSATLEEWEAQYPYGMFAFKETQINLKENAEDGTQTGKLTIYRIGGTSGRADVQVTLYPAISRIDENTVSYANAAGKYDYTVKVEGPWDIAEYQPYGDELSYLMGDVHVESDDGGITYYLTRGEYSEDPNAEFACIPASDATNIQWQIRFFSEDYSTEWEDINGAVDTTLNLLDDTWQTLLQELLDAGAEWDFRCSYMVGDQKYYSYSWYDAEYDPKSALEYTLPEGFVNDQSYYTYDIIMDGEEFDAYSFDVIFADGEWEKEIIFTACGDDLHEVGEVVSVVLTDSRGADVNKSACTASVAIEDDEPELPSHMGFEDAEVWVDKSAGTVRIPLTRYSEGLQYVTGVDFETRDGTALMGRDYAKAEGTAIFLSDLDYTYIELDIVNDMVELTKEDSELYFTIVLTAAKGGGPNSTLIEDRKEIVVRLYNTVTEGTDPNIATELYSPDEDDLTGSLTDTGAVVPGSSVIIARAEEEKPEIELTYSFTGVSDPSSSTYEYTYPGTLTVSGLVGKSGYWKNRAALAGYPGNSDNEQGWRSDKSLWYFDNTDDGKKHCGTYNGSGWYSTSQRGNELRTSINPGISGYSAQDLYTEWYWKANSYADYNGKDWTDIRPTLYYGSKRVQMTDSPIAQKDKYSASNPAYRSGTIAIENRKIDGEYQTVTGVGFWGNYRTGGVLDYDAQNSIRLTESYLTRRTLKAPKVRIYTADDDAIEAAGRMDLLDAIKPTITMQSGLGGAKDANTIYAGSRVTITRGLSAAGYEFARPANGKLDQSIFYSSSDPSQNFTWGQFDKSGDSASLILVQDGDNYNTQGYINVVMDRLQTINLNIAPSVPRKDGSTAVDTTQVDDALNSMWAKIGNKGISVEYRIADYVYKNGDDGYSNVKTMTITKDDLAAVNGTTSSKWSENTLWKLGKSGDAGTTIVEPNEANGQKGNVLLKNVKRINFNLPAEDLIVYQGESYAGNEWISISMDDFLNQNLMFYYYSEEYVNAINTMTLSIARIERYIDLNGDGVVKGSLEGGIFVADPSEKAWNTNLSDSANIAAGATYYQLPILADGSYSITELAPQLTPIMVDGKLQFRQIVLKVYYNMLPRCLMVPAGASASDRAEIIPAAVTTVTTPHLRENMTDEQLGYRYLDHNGTGLDHLMYTAAATSTVFMDVPLGGDANPADIDQSGQKVVWNPKWQGDRYNEAAYHSGNATPMQFADPEAIYLDNTPVGDRYAVGLEAGRSVDESGRVIVLWPDDYVYDDNGTTDPDDDKKGSYVEPATESEYLGGEASRELTPEGKTHVQNYLAALQEHDTIALCVREYPTLPTGSEPAPTALGGIESSLLADFYTYPTSVGARQMTDPMNTGAADQNPNKTQGFDSSEADTGMDEYNMDGRISMPELDMNLTSLVNIATSGQDIVITVGFSPLTVARETKVKKQDGTWARPEVGSPASNTEEGVAGVTQLVNTFRGRGDSVQKEMRSFFREMRKAKTNKPAGQHGIRAAGVNVDISVSLSMVLKWNPLENEFFFNQMMIAVAAGIEFSYTVRLTPCPVFYCTVTVGFTLEIAMGLEATRIKVKGGEWDLGEEMGETFTSETGSMAGKWFEIRGQKNLGSSDAEEPENKNFVVGLPGSSFSVKTVEKAVDIVFNGELYVDAVVLDKNGNPTEEKPDGFSPGTIKGDGGDPVTIKLAEKVDGKNNDYTVMVTFTVVNDGEKRYYTEGKQTKQIITYETNPDGSLKLGEDDKPIVEYDAGFCLVDRVVAIDKQTFDVFFTGVVISPELFLEFAVGVGCELFSVELFINITIGCSFSLYSHESEKYEGEDDEDSAFAFNEFSFLAGIGFRVTALFFNFEFNAVQLAVTYDREAKFDEASQKNSGWNTIWYAANQPVKKYSLLDDESTAPANADGLLGMNIILPGALTHDETLYTIDDNLGESGTFAFNPTDSSVPFQYSGYGTSGDAYTLGSDLVSGSTYELVTVGETNYIVYTVTVKGTQQNPIAGINETRLVISKVQETVEGDKTTYGLAHPFGETDAAYAVLDSGEFRTTEIAGGSPQMTETNFGDLEFDAWVDGDTIRVAFVSYTDGAEAAYTAGLATNAMQAMAEAGKHTVVKTVTVTLPTEGEPTAGKVSAPVVVSSNNAGHGMYYAPSGATNVYGHTMIFYAEAIYHEAGTLATELAKYEGYYNILTAADINTSAGGVHYGEGDPSGAFQYEYKAMQLMTYGKSFYPTFAVLTSETKVTTTTPAGAAEGTAGDPQTTYTADITKLNAADWVNKGVQLENATLTAIDDEFYIAYSTVRHELVAEAPEATPVIYEDEASYRTLYLQTVKAEMTSETVQGTTVTNGDNSTSRTDITTLTAAITPDKAIALRKLVDYANSNDADGVYAGGARATAYTDPYFANVQFLYGKLGEVKGTVEEFQEEIEMGAATFTGEVPSEYFLIFEMNGNTYIIPQDDILSITATPAEGETRSGRVIPFFTRETAEELSAAVAASEDVVSEVKGTPAVTNVTFGVDGNGNIAAVYTQNVPNSPNNAVYLTKYDPTAIGEGDTAVGAWGAGTMLAMRDMQTYEDSIANNWTAEETITHFYDENKNGKLDIEDAPQSFHFNKLSVGFAGKDRILILAEGTLMQLEAVGEMQARYEWVDVPVEGSDPPATVKEYKLQGITEGEGFSFSPAQNAAGTAYDTENGVYALSFGVGQRGIGMAAIHLSNYNLVSGASMDAYVSFVNTGDVSIRASEANPATVTLVAEGENGTYIELAEWIVTENIRAGQQVETTTQQITLPPMTPENTADVINGTQYMKRGGKMYFIVSEDAEYIGTDAFSDSTFVADEGDVVGESLACLPMEARVEMGFESFGIEMIGEDGDDVILQVNGLQVGNRGSKHSDKTYLHFRYTTMKTDNDGNTYTEYSDVDLSQHKLSVSKQQQLTSGYSLLDELTLQRGYLLLATTDEGVQQDDANPGQIKAGYGRTVSGIFTVPKSIFDTGSGSESLNLVVSIESYTAVEGAGGEVLQLNDEYNLTNNEKLISIEQKTVFDTVPGFNAQVGTTLRLPLAMWTSREAAPSVTLTEMTDDGARHIGILYYDANNKAIVAIPTSVGTGKIRIADPETHSYYDICYTIEGEGLGLNIYNDNLIFTWYDKNGKTVDTTTQSEAQSGWGFTQALRWPDYLTSATAQDTVPLRSDLAKGAKNVSFSFQTQAKSIELFFMGTGNKPARIEVSDSLDSFPTTTYVSSDASEGVTIDFGLNGLLTHTVTVKVVGGDGYSDAAYFDKMIETFAGDTHVKSDPTAPDIFWNRDVMPETGTLKGGYTPMVDGPDGPTPGEPIKGESAILAVYFTDLGGLASVTVNGVTPEDGTLTKVNDNLWKYETIVTENGHYRFVATDTTSNTTSRDLTVDWFLATEDAETTAVATPVFDVTVAEDRKHLTVVLPTGSDWQSDNAELKLIGIQLEQYVYDNDTAPTIQLLQFVDSLEAETGATYIPAETALTLDNNGNALAGIYRVAVTLQKGEETVTGYLFLYVEGTTVSDNSVPVVTLKSSFDGTSLVYTVQQGLTSKATNKIKSLKLTFTPLGGTAEAPRELLDAGVTGTAFTGNIPLTGLGTYTLTATDEEGKSASSTFTIETLRVHFDKNDILATGSMTALEVQSADVPLTPNAFLKEGHAFVGWNTQADGSGTTYAEGAPITLGASDMTLYAQWKVLSYTITVENLDNNNGTETITQDYGTTVEEPANSIEGWTFLGWTITDEEPLPDQGGEPGEIVYDAFPKTMPAKDMTIRANWQIITYPVHWYNHDREAMVDENAAEEGLDVEALEIDGAVNHGEMASYDGETPEKEADAQWTYVFKGWALRTTLEEMVASGQLDLTLDAEKPDDILVDVTSYMIKEPTEFIAQYDYILNDYDVTWKNFDGEVLEVDRDVPYGTMPEYNGETPKMDTTIQYYHPFDGWDMKIEPVTGDVTYTAVFKDVLRYYSVVWANEDGSYLEEDPRVAQGTFPTYDGPTPEKAADAKYTYTFKGWNKPVTIVMGDTLYKATYEKTLNTYTVTWLNADGTLLYVDEHVPYGTVPVYNGETPVKAATPDATYTFKGWNETPGAITGDTVYTAAFDTIKNMYTVTFVADGHVIATRKVAYGEDVEMPTIPAKEGYTKTAPVWDRDGKHVTSDLTVQAMYTINTYAVTFVADGKIVKTESVEHGKDATAPAIPEKEGYSKTAPVWDQDGKNITEDTVITASYTKDPTTPTQTDPVTPPGVDDGSSVVIVVIVIVAVVVILALIFLIFIFAIKKKKENEMEKS